MKDDSDRPLAVNETVPAPKAVDRRRLAGGATRQRILDAAEPIFASKGYEGASVREIAAAANADLALVSYHFGSKLGLYREMFLRRGARLNLQRVADLQVALDRHRRRPNLSAIVRALVSENIRLRNDPALGGLPFARLIARELIDPNERERGIIGEVFDDSTRRFLAAIAACFPGVPPEALHWAYHFAIGTLVQTMANTGRLEALSGGACRMTDVERAIDHLVPFIVHGIKGCIAAHHALPRPAAGATGRARRAGAPTARATAPPGTRRPRVP